MSDFIEFELDKEYLSLREKGLSIIQEETKESIEEWLRQDKERMMQEMQDDFLFGKKVAVTSSVSLVIAKISIDTCISANNDTYDFSIAA